MSRKTTWVKGMKSPNPDGRPIKAPEEVMEDQELKDYLRSMSPKAIRFLGRLLTNRTSTDAIKFKAAVKLLETDVTIIIEEERTKRKEVSSTPTVVGEEEEESKVTYSLTAVKS